MFAEFLRRAAGQFSDRTAIQCGDEKQSYSVLYDRSCRLSNILADAGLAIGDRVASLGENSLYSFEEMTALAIGGFVRSPLYVQDTPERQAFMIERVRGAALIVDGQYWPLLSRAIRESGYSGIKAVLVRDFAGENGGSAYDYEAAISSASTQDHLIRVDPDAPYVIRFSAGTTGMPKPIVHSERAYHLGNLEVFSRNEPLDEDDSYLAVSPYSHGSGNLVWPFASVGARHVVMQGGFDADRALEMIEGHRITTMFLVPTMIQRLLASPRFRDTDISSVKRIIYGASKIPGELIEGILSQFGDVLCQLYGQSELFPVTALTPRDHQLARQGNKDLIKTAGRPSSNCFVRIEDDKGNVVPHGTIGEIVADGPGKMAGIYNDEVATVQRFTSDGWVRTHDLGWLDEKGYLHVADRKDDIIISGGFNISPFEIEDALHGHPAVAEAVAFGVPHASWGSTPMAVVRLKPGREAEPDELIEWCRGIVGAVKKPTMLKITSDSLPTNSAGKILRREAKSIYFVELERSSS